MSEDFHDELEGFVQRFKKRFGCLPHGKDDPCPPDEEALRFKLTDAFREIESLHADNGRLANYFRVRLADAEARVAALEPVVREMKAWAKSYSDTGQFTHTARLVEDWANRIDNTPPEDA